MHGPLNVNHFCYMTLRKPGASAEVRKVKHLRGPIIQNPRTTKFCSQYLPHHPSSGLSAPLVIGIQIIFNF